MSRNFLSICALVRNEVDYLDEWINYHKHITGVDHFYIYNNESTDGTEEILELYKNLGLVTYKDFPGTPMQIKAYQDYIFNYKYDNHWTAFIDVDEFLTGPVRSFLRGLHYDVSGVGLNWVFFGEGEKDSDVSKLVIKRFTKSAAAPNTHIKSIVRTNKIVKTGNTPHYFKVTGNYVDEQASIKAFDKKQPSFSLIGTAHSLWIAHYHTKSWPEYLMRKTNPGASQHWKTDEKSIKQKFDKHNFNDVEDFTLANFSEKVSLAIKEVYA